ncbi:MAG: TIGR03862 family flavoprotein [Ilumatobacteraceae bacterium]
MTRSATIVGGGAAGLMAAQVLARDGIAVTVHEHMPSVGRKLLLAGRGGLNITHSESIDQMLGRYGNAADRLRPAMCAFTSGNLRSWCRDLGETTFVGSSGRVFPASFRATPLLRAWLGHLAHLGVRIEVRSRWLGWGAARDGGPDAQRLLFSRSDGTTTEAVSDVAVFALGGASWPRVGSDGGWVDAFRRAGVEVIELRPANCGVRIDWTVDFANRFVGMPLKNVAVTVDDSTIRGDAMVTGQGMEGGPVYAVSRNVREHIDRDGRCTMLVDLQPDLTAQHLADRFDRRRPKDSVGSSLRRAIGLSPVAVSLLREVTGNRLPRVSTDLAALIKAVPLITTATMPIARAISTAGGVSLDELDDSFMLRRLPGTFAAGEMIDWEAPTGGYLLQASFSTAVAAARGAIAWMSR